MAETTTTKQGGGLSPHARRPLVETARGVVAQVAARVPGISGEAAVRNAWEAACSDLERRQLWDDVYEEDPEHPPRPASSRSQASRPA